MEQREKTDYYHRFDPPSITDPKSDLEDLIERKTIDIQRYMKKDDRNEIYLKKLLSELRQLESTKNKIEYLRLYPEYCQIDAVIKNSKDDYDGITIRIPFVENPQDDRFYLIDYTKKYKQS